MKVKRFVASSLALCMAFSLAFSGGVAYAAEEEQVSGEPLVIEELDGSSIDVDLTKDAEAVAAAGLEQEIIDAEEEVRVIIVMEGDSIIEEDSGAVLNSETEARMEALEEDQAAVVSEIEESVLEGESLEVAYNYTWLLNGVAAKVPYGAISEIEALKGVKRVLLQPVYDVCDTEVTTNIAYPMTVSDGVMIGRESAWADGYTGEGMKIAIIDTGLDEDHQNFGALPEEKLTAESATPETVDAALPKLNASVLRTDVTVDKVYRSTKVAYGFNYVDKSFDITHDRDTAGDHGTHVAGIAAANKVDGSDVVGVAPDAQLYVMKVFGKNGGAYTEDILAGLEDALLLGADVVNMSLGSPAGFTTDGEEIDEIYARVSTTGTVLAVSAGNSYTMGHGNAWGTEENLTGNPDNAVIASPGTYANVLSVASIENAYYNSDYLAVGDHNIAFSDGSNGPNRPLKSLAGQELQIVAIPGNGEAENYDGLDVAGKIALVQRGAISFGEKAQNAEAAGAVACLVYNNVNGTIGMDLTGCTATIPCASLSLVDGAYLLSVLEAEPAQTVVVGEGQTLVASSTANQMSDFSSWGVAPDLSLEPDITAPGGNIYSTLDGGNYGLMSGTSMASPNVAGMSALVSQYAQEKYGLSGEELHSFVKNLLMSTSGPVSYDGSLYYSPRNQGSGLANVYHAVTTQAYLSVDGCDTPKAELRDDPTRSGSYSYSFDVKSFGSKDLFYDLSTVAQTEDVDETYADYGYYFMSSTPRALSAAISTSSDSMVLVHDVDDNGAADSHDAYLIYQAAVVGNPADENWTDVTFRYNLDGNETADAADVQAYLDALVDNESPADLTAKVLRVAAGQTAKVDVSVSLADTDKAYFDTYYKNGGYVEGYTFLTALNTKGVDLSLPYLGFYGAWDEAPVIDSGFYWEEDDETEYSQYPNILWTQMGNNDWLPGLNPYVDEAFDVNHISLSPNNDGYADSISDIYVSLLRNAAKLTIAYTGEDGTVYSEDNLAHEPKSYYSDNYGQIIPFVYSWYSQGYDLTDENGSALPNNTRLNLTISASIDYEGARTDVWQTPIVVDTQAPELLDAVLLQDEAAGKYYVELTFRDNVSVAAVNFVNSNGMVLYGQYAADDADATVDENGNRVWKTRYDITGLGDHFTVALGDYALNESYYALKAPGNDVAVDGTVLYGYRVSDDTIYDDSLYGWVSMEISADDEGNPQVDTKACSSEFYVDYSLTAAEQVGGYIIACDANNDLVWIRPGYWDERSLISHLDVQLRDMCYDPVEGVLYGLTTGSTKLVSIDIQSGEVKTIGSLSSAITLACDEQGNLYGINSTGISGTLRTINKENATWGDTLATSADGVPGAYYAQSMTYKDGVFYWAQYGIKSFQSGYGNLYAIAQNEDGKWAATKLGPIAGNAEVVGLLWLDTNEVEWPENPELQELSVNPEATTLLLGGSTALSVIQTPWYATAEVEWSSSNENVAVVDAEGNVLAVGVGKAEITVAAGDIRATATVTVVDPQSELTGFIFSDLSQTLYNQWGTFSAAAPQEYTLLTETSDVSLVSAEYVNGLLYGYDEVSNFYTIDPADFSCQLVNSRVSKQQITDMAYDYTTGNLYGLLTDASAGQTSLVSIDPLTGRFTTVGTLSDNSGNMALAMAVDNHGIVYYVCDRYGYLCTYDPAADTRTVVGLTGYVPIPYIQSMAFDHDTEELYWAAFTNTSCGILYVDQETGRALELGAVSGGAEITGLHTVPVNPPETPYVEVAEVDLTQDTVTLVEGATAIVPVEVKPYNATERQIQWTVADEGIATINGAVITGIAPGKTTATGTLGDFSVALEINVIESAGAFRSFVLGDFVNGSMGYWMEMEDSDVHTPGEADFVFMSDMDVYAATYYDGYLWTYGEDPSADDIETAMHLRKEDPQTGDVVVDYTGYDYFVSIMDMAFDYSEGAVYAVGNLKNTDGNSTLYTFDLADGSMYSIAELSRSLMTLACSEDGQLYAVDTDGVLYRLNKRDGELTAVGDTGYPAHGYQSMAFDYKTGNLYWARTNYISSMWGEGVQDSDFLQVNTGDASVLNLGSANAQLSGLYFPTDKEPVVPEVVKPQTVTLNTPSLLLEAGGQEQLAATVLPVSIRDVAGELHYATSDPAVATVDDNGVVTAVSGGSAIITVSCDDLSATCTVNVVDDSVKLYAVNAEGWEATRLLEPGEKLDEAALAEEFGLRIAKAAYNTEDGYVYAVDEQGYLWRMTLDLGTAEKIGEQTITESVTDMDAWLTPVVVDVACNPYDGALYALIGGYYYDESMDFGYFESYSVYALNTQDGTAAYAQTLSDTIMAPATFSFNGENSFLVYDTYRDYVYEVVLGDESTEPKTVLWAQHSLAADSDSISMIYSKDLDRLFILAVDSYYGSGNQALYMFNPGDGSFGIVADGAWTKDVVSLLLVEGADAVMTELQEEELNELDLEEPESAVEPAKDVEEPADTETPAAEEPVEEAEKPAETETPAEEESAAVSTEEPAETPAAEEPAADAEAPVEVEAPAEAAAEEAGED